MAGLLTGWGQTDLLVVLVIIIGYGFIGFLDDYIKVVLKRSLGLRARENCWDRSFWQPGWLSGLYLMQTGALP